MVIGLLEAGVDMVEATSFVSPQWVPKMGDAEVLIAQIRQRAGDGVLAAVRALIPNEIGLERALATGVKRVSANLCATESFSRRNLNRSISDSVTGIGVMGRRAKAEGWTLDVGISVAFGCPFEGDVDQGVVLDLVLACQELGVEEIGLADTIGVAHPHQVRRLLERLFAAGVEPERLCLHCHDTRGLGLTNALVAYQEGVTRFEGSIGGIGGCPFAPRATGNNCSEDMLDLLLSEGAQSGVNLRSLCELSEGLEAVLGRALPGRLYRAGIWTGEPSSSNAQN